MIATNDKRIVTLKKVTHAINKIVEQKTKTKALPKRPFKKLYASKQVKSIKIK